MPRRRNTIYVGTTISLEEHGRLVALADELDSTVAEVLRECIGIAVQTQSKSSTIREAISRDLDDRAS